MFPSSKAIFIVVALTVFELNFAPESGQMVKAGIAKMCIKKSRYKTREIRKSGKIGYDSCKKGIV